VGKRVLMFYVGLFVKPSAVSEARRSRELSSLTGQRRSSRARQFREKLLALLLRKLSGFLVVPDLRVTDGETASELHFAVVVVQRLIVQGAED